MVNFTKWILIAAGLVGLGLFTQEAAATGLTGTLQRTGLGGSAIGSGAAAAGTGIGQGIGGLFKGILSPFWEVRNIVRGFMNLGSATPWLEDSNEGQGGGSGDTTGDGGGSSPVPVPIIQGSPDLYTGGGFTYYNDPSISSVPVADVTVHGQDLPLSAEAIAFYKNLGVAVVESEDGGGTNEWSGGGGGSANVSSGGNPLAAAHAAGYSLGSV